MGKKTTTFHSCRSAEILHATAAYVSAPAGPPRGHAELIKTGLYVLKRISLQTVSGAGSSYLDVIGTV